MGSAAGSEQSRTYTATWRTRSKNTQIARRLERISRLEQRIEQRVGEPREVLSGAETEDRVGVRAERKQVAAQRQESVVGVALS
jgi:hypothetical protein